MSSNLDYNRMLQLRNEIIGEITKDIFGPRAENELIPTSPTKKYFTGVLYPQNNFDLDYEPEKKIETNDQTETNESDEIDAKVNRTNYPSSMGLTCKIKDGVDIIKLEIEYAKYSKPDADKWNFQRIPIKDHENKIITIPIKLIEGVSKPKNIGDETATIKYHIRKNDGDFLISVFLQNNLRQSNDRLDPTLCIYQPVIRLLSKNSTDKIFKNTLFHDPSDDDSPDSQLFGLLFRHRKQFGVGHSCSVTWNTQNMDDFTNKIETTFMPQYEVQKIASNDDDAVKNLQALDMKFLADIENFADYKEPLLKIYELYGNWIKKLIIPENHNDITESQIEKCENTRERIKNGIILVSSDKKIGEAFRFTNRVMLYQRSYSEWAKLSKDEQKLSGRKKPELKGKWRLFQIAFILLNIESISNNNSKERKIADVLWFPSGGGKTEAYLGVIAFTIGLRRLGNSRILKYGVAVIMRYTLRLLTLQQFQRAATFMCACEIIRKTDRSSNDKSRLGEEPFLVGLWLGQTSTPNKLKGIDGAKSQLNKIRQNPENVTGSNPYQIRSCPWCGNDISPKNYDFGGQIEHMRIFCSNDNCEFSRANSKEEIVGGDGTKSYEERGLPVLLIDEDIYKLCPTLVIATIDKFAQISWNWKTASLFGKIDKYSKTKGFITSNDPEPPVSGITFLINKCGKDHLLPPELIIQDELHLISGPLGTLTSLYETAIDDLCTTEESSPKIIASTATTKNSPEQVKQLFNIPRNQVKIFPPQGFSFGDSFFAKEIPINEEYGKIYLGVCPTSRTGLTILARIAAVILQTIRTYRHEGKYTDEELDPYYTVVSYFNSIKELANANRVFDDSVPDFMRMIQNKYDQVKLDNDKEQENSGNSKYSVPNLYKEELTSRKNANEIPAILKQLDAGLTTENKPLDVLLCTNMIQVGVDVDRFGVMIINGQPKQTSEYIQASGRTGRKYPGLIITSYNYLKPRDLSHYENFIYYHSTFHQYVEPVSITPFSSRSRDRGLLGVVVGLIRLNSPLLSKRNSAHHFEINSSFQPLIDHITKSILDRVSKIEPAEMKKTQDELQRKIFEFWDKRSSVHKNLHFDKNPYPFARENSENKYLMKSSVYSTDEESILVPTSLREAEDEIKLKYYSKKFSGEDHDEI